MNADQRIQLRETLVTRFDLEELRTLCDNLDVDFENLPARGKAGKARELVRYMERHNDPRDPQHDNRLHELAVAIESFLTPKSQPAAQTQTLPPQPTTPNYKSVHIRIFEATLEQDTYPVELTGERTFPRREFRLDKQALDSITDKETYGRALGEALFDDQSIGNDYRTTLEVFRSHQWQARVHLQLDAPALHDLRWERIYHPIGGSWYPLAATADTLLSRYVPAQAWGQPVPLTIRPLRVLVILASPRDLPDKYHLPRISADELAAWHAIFDDQPNVSPTYLESESTTSDPPTLNHIRRALMDGGYHVVHFVCHGATTQRGPVLYLENADGDVEAVRSERLLEMFRVTTNPIHLCFLAACESGSWSHAQKPSAAFIPLGPQLVAEGRVPAVVAMADRVGIETAREFAHQFYDRVLTHGTVDLAVHEARAIVRDRGDWSVPVLFSSLENNQLFGVSATPGGLIPRPASNTPVPVSPLAQAAPNPFGVKGRITDPDRFFGREELLRQIFEELNKGTNLSLVGESQVGKSSLLSMVCALGPERINLPPEAFAYLNLEWVDAEDDFYEALCDALGIETCRGYQLTRVLRGKRHVLCLDEMEKMAWDGFTVRVRSQLRGLASDGITSPLRLVIASRSPLAHLFPDSPELTSPLDGICHQLDVGPFPADVARALLAHYLQRTGVTFTESEIVTLITQTGGHPAKLQHAAAELYNVKREM